MSRTQDHEPSSGKGAFASLLAGAGCLVMVLAMLAIWVSGLIALFD